MRAAATNLADILTHELALGYVLASVLLGVLTMIAARFTDPDFHNQARRVWTAPIGPRCSSLACLAWLPAI
jgi:hypothetical protein